MAYARMNEPLERMIIDIVGPFHRSVKGNQYILVAVDCSTKWMELIPIPDQGAKTCARQLIVNVFAKVGVPRSLQSEQGSEFLKDVFNEVCRFLNVEHMSTGTWRPRSNKIAKRLNQTVVSTLKLCVCGDKRDWDLWLPLVDMAYNGNAYLAADCSPYYEMYGQPMKIPSELVLPKSEEGCSKKSYDLEGYLKENFVDKLWESLNHVQRLVRDNLRRATEIQKGKCTHGIWSKYYTGQGVWLRVAGKNSSFEPHPYAVINVLGDVLCKIQRNVYSKSRIVHCERLEPMNRPYNGQWVFGPIKEKGQSSSEEYLDGVSNLFLESKEENSHAMNEGNKNEIVVASTESEDSEVNGEAENIANVTPVTENNISEFENDDVQGEHLCQSVEGYAGPMTRSRTRKQ